MENGLSYCRMVDTHAHLSSREFDGDLENVLERAARKGVEWIVSVGEDLEDDMKVLELAERHKHMVKAGLGFYPGKGDIRSAMEIGGLIKEKRNMIRCIGEVGIDFRIEEDPGKRRAQEEILEYFIGISNETGLPLSVHSRSAGRRAIEILASNKAGKVILHAFDGKARYAREGAEKGFFFSVPPSIVRSRQKEKMVASLPLERILLESDSPVLGPVPGKRNEPCFMVFALQSIARIKGILPEEAAEVIYRNTMEILGP